MFKPKIVAQQNITLSHGMTVPWWIPSFVVKKMLTYMSVTFSRVS